MKNLYSFLIGLLVIGSLSTNAQSFVIGTGTATNTQYSYPTPFGNWYTNMRAQYLYTATELNAAGMYPGTINQIAFNVTATNGAQPLTSYKVYMKNTTTTSLTAWEGSMGSEVFGPQTIDPGTGWYEMDLSTPFNWNGSDNIIVEVCFDLGTNNYTYNHSVQYSSGYSYIASRTFRSDSQNGCGNASTTYQYTNRPNIRFNVLPPYADDAGISAILSPSIPTCDLDSLDITVVLENLGTDTLVNCSINYQINSGSTQSMYYTGSVAPLGGNDTVTIANESFSNGDLLEIWTTMPNGQNDSLSANDSASLETATGLSGTYGIPADYATINDATTDLETFGVCGDVVFNLAAGTYNENVSIGDVLGTSEDATITFQGASGNWNDVTIAGSSSPTIAFDGVDFITFKDLKVTTSSGNPVQIPGQSDNVTLDHVWLRGVHSTSNPTYSLIYTAGTPNDLTIVNSKLEKGSSWMYSNSGSTTTYKENYTINDNVMKDQAYGYGYIYYVDGMEMNNNRFVNDSAFSFGYGYMPMGYWNYVNNFNVTGNYVGATAGTGFYYGAYMLNCVGSSNPRSQFANNCIVTGNDNTGNAYYALYMSNSGLVDIHHNSFTHSSSTNTYTIYINGGGAISMKNNNIVNLANNYAIYINGGFTITESNYNNYYSEGNSIIYFSGSAYSSIEDYYDGTGNGLHSISADPEWEDLMLCKTCSDEISNAGEPLSNVTADIEGNVRSTVNPDIGAVEFINASSFSLGGDDTVCGNELLIEAGPAQSVAWGISENGGSTQTYTTSTVTLTPSGNGPSDFNVSVAISTAYCGNASDNVVIRLVPDATLDSNIHICADETSTLNPGGGAGATYAWNTGATTATLEATEAGSYSVVKMEEGCESEATIMVSKSTAVDIADVEGCETDAPLTIDATIPDGTSYAWTGGSSTTSPANTFSESGTYSVTATDTYGCVSNTEFDLLVLGEPEADISFNGAGAGTAIQFFSTGSSNLSPNTTYLWTFNNFDTSTDANPTYVFPFTAEPTSYPVSLVIDNGCGQDLDNTDVLVSSVDEVSVKIFEVYPNPANEFVTISAGSEVGNLNITVLDNTGRIVLTKNTLGENVNEINISDLSSGAYIINIAGDNMNEVHSLIVE